MSNVATTRPRSDSSASGHTDEVHLDAESNQERSVNGLGIEGTDATDEEQSGMADTPVASRRVSRANVAEAPPLPAGKDKADTSLEVEFPPTPLSPEYHSANESPDSSFEEDDDTPTGTTRERKVSSNGSTNALMRPGVMLRIKRKEDRPLSTDIPTEISSHEKLSTEDSTLSEIIVTPAASRIVPSTKGSEDAGSGNKSPISPNRQRKPAVGIEEEMGPGGEAVEEKRLSGMSDSTIAFGTLTS